MSGVTDSHKTAASVQSEKSVESAEPAEIVAVTQGETERRMSDLSAPAGASSHGKGRLSARGNWHTRLRVGIMGGTFDPIHNGHLVAASEVAWVYDLDEVIFVPTGRPVFKLDKHVTNAEDRYLMTVIATASNPKFTVSRVDIDRPASPTPSTPCAISAPNIPTPSCSSSPAQTPWPKLCSGRTPTSCGTSPTSWPSRAPATPVRTA